MTISHGWEIVLKKIHVIPFLTFWLKALILQENHLASIYAKTETKIKLTPEGEIHAENGLPERRLLNAVIALGGKATLNQAAEESGLDKQFAQIALGWTQRKKWAIFDSKTGTLQVLSGPKEGNDEKLLNSLCGKEEMSAGNLNSELHVAVEMLKILRKGTSTA